MDRREGEIVLVMDLDNTLYDFAAFFAYSFRAMVHALSKRTRVPEDVLVNDFRSVFDKHESLEYTFAVQELPCLTEFAADMAELVHLANVAFGRARRKRLQLYPEVKEVLQDAHAAGVKLCVATNAPFYQAFRRLRDLGVFRFFCVISCREGLRIPDELTSHRQRYDSAAELAKRQMLWRGEYEQERIKPHPDMFASIKEQWKTPQAAFYSIGDNVANDLYPSSLQGMTTIWARYGTRIDPSDRQTMVAMTPARFRIVLERPEAQAYQPDHVIDNFAEVCPILAIPRQMRLI